MKPGLKSIWKQLDQILVKGDLADISQFYVDGFFDEIPLFHRFHQLDFIMDRNDRDEVIMGWALNYLSLVEKNSGIPSKLFFAAITFLSYDDEVLWPRIYVYNGGVQQHLFGLMKPRMDIKTAFTKKIRDLTLVANPGIPFYFMEDWRSISNEIRVLVTTSNFKISGR